MNAEQLLAHYDRIADAPDAVSKLREFVLALAVQGKLVTQLVGDPSLAPVLKESRKDAARRAACIGRMRWEPSAAIGHAELRDLPDGWVAARINDTGFYINGLAFKPSDWAPKGVPIIRIQNLTDPAKSFNLAKGQFPDEVTVRDGDILVSWSATLDAFIWNRGEGVLNQHIFRVIPDERLTSRRYLHLVLRNAIRELGDGDHARGLVMTHIKRAPFLAHVVGLPPLSEQDRIIAKLDELMALCDQLEAARTEREVMRDQLAAASLARLNALEPKTFTADARFALNTLPSLTARADQIGQFRQTILNLAIRGSLVSQNASDESASELLRKLLRNTGASAIRMNKGSSGDPLWCPDGWGWATVQQLLDPNREISYGVIKLGTEPKAGGVPTLRCSDVREGFIDLSNVRNVEDSIEAQYVRTRLRGGEVVINVRGTLGGVALVPPELKGYNLAREVAIVPLAGDLCGRFFVYLMRSPYFWGHIEANLRGIAYKGLNLGILRQIPVPLPPFAEQHRIVAKLDELMALCDQLEASLAAADKTRRRLLDALLAEALQPALQAAA